MQTLYCIQHVPYEHPGIIMQWATSRALTIETLLLQEDPVFPRLNPDDMLLVMGGPMGAFDDAQYPWMPKEKQFIKDAIAHRIPTIGICLGAQMIAAVLDADVTANAYTEIGFFPVAMSKSAAQNPLFSDVPRVFTPFHWHSDTFFIPKGAMRIAGNDACMNQGFIGPGKVLGLQFHLEVNTKLIDEWTDKLPPQSDPPYVQSLAEITAAAARHTSLNRTILETVLDRFYLTHL